MTDDGRNRAWPSTAGAAEGAAPATGDAVAIDSPPSLNSSAPSAEEISAQVAGFADDPKTKAFKHRISADASISGRIHFPGNARIDGKLKGEIRADALLVVGESALLEADVRADRLLLRGTVRGSVICLSFAEFAPGSVLIGNIAAAKLLVRPGAKIEGACRVGLPVSIPAAGAGDPEARARTASSIPWAAAEPGRRLAGR